MLDRLRTKSQGTVPSRIMKPRVIYIAMVVLLVLFGMLMIYSASSVYALGSADFGNNPLYFVRKQVISLAIGLIICLIFTAVDYHRLLNYYFLMFCGVACCLMLLLTRFLGVSVLGASRWIIIPVINMQFQPSEFVKPYLVVAAVYSVRYLPDDMAKDGLLGLVRGGFSAFMQNPLFFSVCLLAPTLLIVIQPDKGTTMIVVATIVALYCMTGKISSQQALGLVLMLVVLMAVYFVVSYFGPGYSGIRVKAWISPEAYKDNESYQIMQGYYAFGSGGVFGKGIGMSTQKYAYLPMAHNDFIFAIIGEELGILGTLGTIALFLVLYASAFRIAQQASDVEGHFLAHAATLMLFLQFVLNIIGVLGVLPASGKPIPFLSYGGSSLMGALLLVALTLNVSFHTTLPETVHERRRRQFSVYQNDRPEPERTGLFSVLQGSKSQSTRTSAGSDCSYRSTQSRVDSHPSAVDRLRK